ncbi:uncharacterized protein PRCAT00001253001 [Priceomyces carsonii]|uniref:uncharacterized protein n=1 Tax=Priceomyces carsonii TaxID=28549 RepID=UPI002ED91206|nr:unnamed protein product [Priceomyces carsonii]
MLDVNSLEVISRFKQSLLTNELPSQSINIASSNRGNKLGTTNTSLHHITSKVVEYDGNNYLVFTDESIEKENLINQRKWREEYIGQGDFGDQVEDEDEDAVDQFDETDYDSGDEHPLKRIKISEILSPLNHPSEVVSHPAILKIFKLNVYGNLASELIETIEIEQDNLNYLNKLLQVTNGEDWYYLLEENLGLKSYDHGLDDDKTKIIETVNGEGQESQEGVANQETALKNENDSDTVDPFFALPEALVRYEKQQASSESEDDLSKVQDELINYLQISIQRQQEYIKNLTILRNGLVKADRLKQDIYKWGKEMYEKKSS